MFGRMFMFQAEKGLECLTNDVRISLKKMEENHVERYYQKLDKTGSTDGASDSSRPCSV